MLASLPRFTLLARRPRPSAPVNFIYRKQMQIFYNKSNFLFFLPAAALTRPGAGALAGNATFGTNRRWAKKSLPAFLARKHGHKKVVKKLGLEITVESTGRIFAPCRGTGKAVDRCHGHNPAVGRNPESHQVKRPNTVLYQVGSTWQPGPLKPDRQRHSPGDLLS